VTLAAEGFTNFVLIIQNVAIYTHNFWDVSKMASEDIAAAGDTFREILRDCA
jgi:hypothetical protein